MKRLIIFVILAAVALPVLADLTVAATSRQAIVVVQDTRFDPGVQLAADLGLGLTGTRRLARGARAGLGAGLGFGTLLPSQVNLGYIYRGVASRYVWVDTWFAGAGGVGATAEIRGVLGSYEQTTLLFFYPEVSVGPSFRTRITPRTEVEWMLPLSYQFRSDLAVALAVGIRGTLHVEFRAPR